MSMTTTVTHWNPVEIMSSAAENSDSTPEGCGKSEDEPSAACIKLDHLGPIIINTDGTLQRIPNWNEMSDIERTKAMRLLTARNKKRIQALETQAGAAPNPSLQSDAVDNETPALPIVDGPR
jgi:hypothetical protein